jgi:aryl-alcohol dehydrogenase-like predicted oxidoreductase
MKIFAQDVLVGQASPDKLIHYSMSLPVAATVIGMPKVEHIEQNVAAAKAFKPLPGPEMKKMSGDLSEKNKIALDAYFRDHLDA